MRNDIEKRKNQQYKECLFSSGRSYLAQAHQLFPLRGAGSAVRGQVACQLFRYVSVFFAYSLRSSSKKRLPLTRAGRRVVCPAQHYRPRQLLATTQPLRLALARLSLAATWRRARTAKTAKQQNSQTALKGIAKNNF